MMIDAATASLNVSSGAGAMIRESRKMLDDERGRGDVGVRHRRHREAFASAQRDRAAEPVLRQHEQHDEQQDHRHREAEVAAPVEALGHEARRPLERHAGREAEHHARRRR